MARSFIAEGLKGDELEDIDEEVLGNTALSIAEALYMKKVADSYLYADFKGIEQLEKFITSLKLDDVFVNLKVLPRSLRVSNVANERRNCDVNSSRPTRSSGDQLWNTNSQSSTSEEAGPSPRSRALSIDHSLRKVRLRPSGPGGPGSG